VFEEFLLKELIDKMVFLFPYDNFERTLDIELEKIFEFLMTLKSKNDIMYLDLSDIFSEEMVSNNDIEKFKEEIFKEEIFKEYFTTYIYDTAKLLKMLEAGELETGFFTEN